MGLESVDLDHPVFDTAKRRILDRLNTERNFNQICYDEMSEAIEAIDQFHQHHYEVFQPGPPYWGADHTRDIVAQQWIMSNQHISWLLAQQITDAVRKDITLYLLSQK